jgi:hypothetical protein
VNFTGGLTASQQNVFTTAANTWMSYLTGYQAGINISSLTIDASGTTIDGVGGVLGQAGPTFGTSQGGYVLATQGTMQFDTADLANMESNGSLLYVILHEMAHVIGFGTLWTNNGVYVNGTGQFTGANAVSAYQAEYNQPGATYVPVELGGGGGTANGHWNEVDGGAGLTGILSGSSVCGSYCDMTYELMTGWLNGPTAYISNTTIASFSDIGYTTSLVTSTPEPGTGVLLGAGFVAVALFRRRRA